MAWRPSGSLRRFTQFNRSVGVERAGRRVHVESLDQAARPAETSAPIQSDRAERRVDGVGTRDGERDRRVVSPPVIATVPSRRPPSPRASTPARRAVSAMFTVAVAFAETADRSPMTSAHPLTTRRPGVVSAVRSSIRTRVPSKARRPAIVPDTSACPARTVKAPGPNAPGWPAESRVSTERSKGPTMKDRCRRGRPAPTTGR